MKASNPPPRLRIATLSHNLNTNLAHKGICVQMQKTITLQSVVIQLSLPLY
jgi:hypothetical protein